MTYFNKSIATHLLSGFVVFSLMGLWIEHAVADDFIPKLLYVGVNTKVKNANNRIDQFLKKYGKRITVFQCKENPCGKKNKRPFRKIRVKSGTENGWIKILRKSPLVKYVIRPKDTNDRLPGDGSVVEVDDPCAKQALPFISLKYGSEVPFESLENLVKKIYQGKCDNCVQLDESSSLAKKFSIVDLNKEVIKEENFVENLALTFLMTDEEIPELSIVVSGEYAPVPEKKGVPPTHFQEMRCQYHEQLNAYADKFQGKLQGYLENPK